MEWLNYHHLFYFWMITREGGLGRAATVLRVSHSTVSAQLRALEAFLGTPLFERRGKRLVLTPLGAEVAGYAGEIFRLGNELVDVARGRSGAGPVALRVGVVSALPKSLVNVLLEPTFSLQGGVRVHARQGEMAGLLQDLTSHRLHLILADTPRPEGLTTQVHAHLLGESDIWLYGSADLAGRYRARFPGSLQGAPLLLPAPDSVLRRAMERWFADRAIRVEMVADADDAGLLRAFGAAGRGLFPVRAFLRREAEASGAVPVGPLSGVRERYYAISVERRIRHRAVAAVIQAARARFLGRAKDETPAKPKPRPKKVPAKRPPAKRPIRK